MGLEVLTCAQTATKTSYAWASDDVLLLTLKVVCLLYISFSPLSHVILGLGLCSVGKQISSTVISLSSTAYSACRNHKVASTVNAVYLDVSKTFICDDNNKGIELKLKLILF